MKRPRRDERSREEGSRRERSELATERSEVTESGGSPSAASGAERDGGAIHVTEWDPATFAARVSEAMQIYTVAMGYHPSAGVQRGQAAVAHTKLASFRCRAAVTDRDELVGFGYGYASRPGQWWHDLVDRAIAPELVPDWLGDAFELSELHVLPTVQGRGVGRRLLVDLAAVVPTRTMLLSTPDADTRAFRLYRSLGFLDLARNHRFPGDSRAFAVLGRMLPLAT